MPIFYVDSASFFDLSVLDSSTFGYKLRTDTSQLLDASSNVSVNWANRFLIDSVGTRVVDYEAKYLVDSTSATAVDWSNRYLIDENGNNLVDWANSRPALYDTSFVPSVEWNNRVLQDTAAVNCFNWGNRRLYYDNGNLAIDFGSNTWGATKKGVIISASSATGTIDSTFYIAKYVELTANDAGGMAFNAGGVSPGGSPSGITFNPGAMSLNISQNITSSVPLSHVLMHYTSSDPGYVKSVPLSALTASLASTASSINVIDFGSPLGPYGSVYRIPFVLNSGSGQTLYIDSELVYNGYYNQLYTTASQALTSSFATTASYVSTLRQSVIITGSVAIGTGSVGGTENNLVLGPAPGGGVGEGGQIALLAVNSSSYVSTSFIDNYQNQIRILGGIGTTSAIGIVSIDLGTRNASFLGAVTASAYSGLPNDYLYVTRNTDQTVGSNWASTDIIFNNSVVSKGISYNTGTGLASLTGGKVYRITARLAWSAAAAYLLEFSCYNSSNTQLGPTTQIVQSTNGSNNISDGALDFIYAPGSNVDIKIRTTANTTALSGEKIRGDLNTQLIIQQIA